MTEIAAAEERENAEARKSKRKSLRRESEHTIEDDQVDYDDFVSF